MHALWRKYGKIFHLSNLQFQMRYSAMIHRETLKSVMLLDILEKPFSYCDVGSNTGPDQFQEVGVNTKAMTSAIMEKRPLMQQGSLTSLEAISTCRAPADVEA